jgi:mycothiol synthase
MVDVVRVPADAYTWGAHHGPAAFVDRIRSACADTDHHDPLDEAALLRLKHHGLADSALWVIADSGFALAHTTTAGTSLDVAVAPTTRVCGFGGGLVEAALADTAGPVDAWSHGDHPAAAALARRFGFERVRELWVLRCALTDALPDLPGTPGLRGFRPGDEAEVLRVNAAAFAAHPEQGAMSAGNLAERMAEPWFDPEGLLLAFEGERLLGFHWTKLHPRGEGEVYVVGIDPAAQGGGLGRTLTLAGLHHLRARGATRVHLYVESDNAIALRVYLGLGFTHTDSDTHTQYHRPVSGAPRPASR